MAIERRDVISAKLPTPYLRKDNFFVWSSMTPPKDFCCSPLTRDA